MRLNAGRSGRVHVGREGASLSGGGGGGRGDEGDLGGDSLALAWLSQKHKHGSAGS